MGMNRIGMKRDLALLLEGQPHLSETRSPKVGNSHCNGVSETEVNCSVDQSHDMEFQSNGCNGISVNVENNKFNVEDKREIHEKTVVEEEERNDVAEVVVGEESRWNLVRPTCEEGPNNESAVYITQELRNDNVELVIHERGTVETPMITDNGKLHNGVSEKPLMRFTRSMSKLEVVSVETLQLGDTVGTPIIIGDGKFRNGISEKPPMRFTRSMLKPKVEPMKTLELGDTVGSLIVIDDEAFQKGVSEKPPVRFTRSMLKDTVGSSIVTDDEVFQNGVSEKPPVRFTRSMLKPKVEPMETLQSRDTVGTLMVIDGEAFQNGVSEKPPRRFTRSLLKQKVETMEALQSGGNMGTLMTIDDGIQERSPKRFTRSLLKPKVEPIETLQPGNDRSDELEGAKKVVPKEEIETSVVSGTLSTLNKIPSSVKELLQTGLLEGFKVTYKYNGNMEVSRLRGTIKGFGILCCCSLCKGLEVIAPSKFEYHARNDYSHMAKYICLDNGKSLYQVLKACKDSSLDTLERTIKSEIGEPFIKSVICKNCRVSFQSSCAAKVGSLCNTCMESKNFQASPGRMAGKRARSFNAVGVSKSSKRTSLCINSQEKNRWKITKKHMRLHKLVFEEGGLPDGTELGYFSRGKKLLEGYKKGFGIFCRCCNCEVSPSVFEAHAGWPSRRKPYLSIYTSNGVSLHELSLSLSKDRKYSAKDNDDLCIICADGGSLLLCDGCPRAFHKECASLSSTPHGKWYCNYCQNMFQRERFVEHNVNAVAAGRISGVDPIEQISKRCIRIVKNPEAEVSACALCRGSDFSKSSYGPRTVILCDQCEMEFHVGCLKDNQRVDLKEVPKGKWFCCMDCRRIHSTLQKLLVHEAEKLPDSLLTGIRKKQGSDSTINLDVRWRLLSGKFASPETRLLLSKAVAIFHHCFDPIIDPTTGQDLIPSMIYGRKIGDQDFRGMYCAVLTVNSSVVSAGVLRVYGREIAELPLVATCDKNQGKGYFQLLFSCIMKLLAFLNVKRIVLPAAHEAESIWINKFGFTKIAPIKLSNLRSACCQMMTFKGTSMLQKMVPECRVVHIKEEK